MIKISIDRVAQRAIRKKLNNVANNIARAQSRAANRTATSTRAFFSKETRKQVNVKAARLKKSTRIRRARPSRPTAAIDVSGQHVPLIDMGARPTNLGVTVRQYRGSARTLLGGAFIQVMPKNGRRGVFRRRGKRRLPIDQQFGPSVISLWKKRDRLINQHAITTLRKELTRQIQFYRNRR
jgi:hypothetical protein